jgi:hypothetical protein
MKIKLQQKEWIPEYSRHHDQVSYGLQKHKSGLL